MLLNLYMKILPLILAYLQVDYKRKFWQFLKDSGRPCLYVLSMV